MKKLLVTALVLACCVGCGRMSSSSSSVRHTMFFNMHDAGAYFKSLTMTPKLNFGGGGSGSSSGGPTGNKEWEILIKGDEKLRNTLLRDYKDYVEDEVSKSGVSITSRGESGEISGFYYIYEGSRVGGIIGINSAIEKSGYIQINVFMYEHSL